MAETADLSRKKRVRAAHQALVTRMVDQVREMLSSEEGLNVAKLKQKRHALQMKTELLNKLDTSRSRPCVTIRMLHGIYTSPNPTLTLTLTI